MVDTNAATTLTEAGTLQGRAGTGRFVDKTVQVTITGAGTCLAQIQGTIDGSVWCKLGSDIAASELRYIPEAVTALRVVVSSVVGEVEVSATLAGFDPRTGD
jgi:hypothetical protein